ncbi:hypothetical protein EDB92DRAFT_1463746 [Lactarius akahatsu]|uniref:Crinkler effector protein N-terminal domain-containing protein n=1 Tax=Lactarius akahatsu TaxID=416441 RepID=A0AAD4LAP4_9AGAM|nr:hypothetical protein EDB92DRAFT_1463746 [Lactarius akahatsu]
MLCVHVVRPTATTTIMATNLNVWCLLIDEDHEPIFGEPFPVSIRHDDTIHELKVKIQMMWDRHKLSHIPPNDPEIWKCKSLELSARDSFDLTKSQLDDLKFFFDEDSDVPANVQHLGVAQRMTEFSNRRDDEIWLVVVPQNDADFAVFVWDTQCACAPVVLARIAPLLCHFFICLLVLAPICICGLCTIRHDVSNPIVHELYPSFGTTLAPYFASCLLSVHSLGSSFTPVLCA